MIEIKIIPDTTSFGVRIALFKDDEKVTSFNYEILDDLTFLSLKDTPFKGPELSLKDAVLELATMMKNDSPEKLSDVSIDEIVEAFEPLIKKYKIKRWDGEYLPFQ